MFRTYEDLQSLKIITPQKTHKDLQWVKNFFRYALITVLLIFTVFPVLWAMLASFKKPMDAISMTPLFIFKPTLENYSDLFTKTDIPFLSYFMNSVIISLTSMFISILFACMAGYSLARIRPRGSKFLTVFILAVRMLPPIVIIVPLYIFYNSIGILDTLVGLIIPYTALNIPLATWMMHSFFKGLPKQLEEAAMIDGCGRIRTFLNVILPLTAPGIAATSIFCFILAWNDFLLALPLTSISAVPLPVIASSVRAEEGVLWGKLGAVITILVIPVFIFTLFVQKHIISGLVSGAVKE